MRPDLKDTLSLKVEEGEYPLFVCGPGSSSMDEAWNFIREGVLPIWGAVLMESQTGGRGRMGRVWQSPPGHVYGALRLPEAGPFSGPGASLALAFMLAAALAEMGVAAQIKWPNDLIVDGGKAGGILLESKSGGLVAGVGLNLGTPPQGEWAKGREAGAPGPGALPLPGGPLAVWPALVKTMIMLYNKKFLNWSMDSLVVEAEKLLYWQGCQVRVVSPASEPPAPSPGLVGRISGLAPDGCLLLDSAAAQYKLWSGTVCLS